MSMSQTTLLAKVKRYLAGDESSPSIDAIHDNTIIGWANDLLPAVVKTLDPIHTQALHEKNTDLIFASGVEDLPSDFLLADSIRTGNTYDYCKIARNAVEFDKWDYFMPSDELSDEELKSIDENRNRSMLEKDTALTFTSGVEDLPSDFLMADSVRVRDTYDYCKIARNAVEFDKWDYISPSEELSEIELKDIDENRNRSMLEKNTALTFASGVEDLPDDFLMAKSVVCGSGDIKCKIVDADEFNRWDSNNFVFTPNSNYPIVLIADDKIYIKPTTITSGKLDYIKKHPIALIADYKIYVKPAKITMGRLDYIKKHPIALIANDKIYIKPTTITTGRLDYIKEHPDISATQDTLFDIVGDSMLVDLVVAKAKQWLAEEDG